MAWEELLNIRDEAIADHNQQAQADPVACPDDGEPLETAGPGVWHCRFHGGFYGPRGVPANRPVGFRRHS